MWTERIKSSCAAALINGKLEGDYFFNRSSVSGCRDPSAMAVRIARIFWRKGMDCYLYDIDGDLAGKGFAKIDTIHVLVAGTARRVAKTRVVQIQRDMLPVWIDVFCRSFAVPNWKEEVERIMDASFNRLELLLSYNGKAPGGCAALYSKNGVTGLYCLGTLSQQRKRGLANDILATAIRLHDNLILQTLGSEGLLPFYGKAAFEVAYAKKIYLLRRATTLRGSKNPAVK
jgi:hypothetical protein